jgi:regulator of sigma E protease
MFLKNLASPCTLGVHSLIFFRMLTVLLFLVVLSLLVFVHEAGHFFAARRLGIAVEEFGFGFPPRAYGIKRGKTIYSVNWIPLGGFVRLKGETGGEKTPESFATQALWKRLVVLLAGVAMNVVLAAVLLSVGYAIGVPQEINGPLPTGAVVREHVVRIQAVLPETPAAKAGFVPGDILRAIDGVSIASMDTFRAEIGQRVGRATTVQVERDNETQTLMVTPAVLPETQVPGIGVGIIETGIVSYPWYSAPLAGVRTTVSYLGAMFASFGELLATLVRTGKPSADVAGPVGIAVLTGAVAKMGILYMIQFVALLSLNLAVVNVLPIPALDGGRVLFLFIERLRGRAVASHIEDRIHQLGFVLLLLLVAIVTFHDIGRLIR